jgi:hypothetical protein
MPPLNHAYAQRTFTLSLLAAAILTVAGCVSAPPPPLSQSQSQSPTVQRLPERVELKQVPFFAQSDHQGAPAALAELLTQQGVATTPEALAKELRLPEQEARLQLNIEAVANKYGLLLHPLRPNLPALLNQVAAGYPVLLRFNRGFAWRPLPRYAVLIGYDRNQQTVLLRSGNDKRLEISFADFTRDWSAAGEWAVLVLSLNQLPLPAAGPLAPAPAMQANAQAARDAAAAGTQELLNLRRRWQQAASNQRAQLRTQLQDKAEQRRQLLSQLLQSYPQEVLRVMIPNDKQVGLPPEVASTLEQSLELDGELDVLYEDYEDGPPKLRHFLKTAFGERFELRLAQPQRQWRSGQRVRAQGWLLAHPDAANEPIQGDLLVNDDDSGLLLLADTNTSSGSTGSALAYDLPNTLGAQRTLAILVNFQDDPANKPWTTAQANSLVFGSVSDFFRENSSQQTWLTGSVAGWYTVALSSTVCDGFAIEQYGKSAAQAAGYNLSNYDRFLFIFPQNACGYSGMGQVGAAPSSAWIHNSLTLRTVGHELGHNLGLQHAHALDCGNTTLGSTCTAQEYGDTLDIMGYSGTVGHFNGFNKERLGWLASSNITNVNSSGSYSLEPASAQTANAKTLKIAKGLDASGAPSYYYVEYRQPTGFDAQITDRGVVDPANVFQGVTVRQASPSNGNSGQLLDMTAGSNFVDMKDAALTGGLSFNDAGNGIYISTQWTDASQALVSVDFGAASAPVCTRSAPTVSVNPAQSNWLPAGSSYSYSATLTNQDSSACANSSFSLSSVKPSGWSANLGSSSLSLAPGASGNFSLSVGAPSTASNGFYNVGASASANAFSGTGGASFVVDNPVTRNQAPTAQDDSVVLSSISPVTIAVLANDRDPDGDTLSIVSFTQGAKGSVTLNSNASLTYTPAKSFKTDDQFSYSITDGQSTASTTVTISLQSSAASSNGANPGGGASGGKGKR